MEFPLHPSPCARIRHRMSSLDCVPMPRDFRVSILHRERMKRKEEEENRRKVFFSLFPREESTEGDVQRGRISSLVRGARDPSFRPIFRSCVFSRMGHDLRRNFNECHAATRMLPSIRARSIDFANRFP